jgi:3-oxoacyl-[acyl-carrier-protein] synthase II
MRLPHHDMEQSMKEVVVTGMGLVTPLGVGVSRVWGALTDGLSGIRPIERFPVDDLPARIAGFVPEGLKNNGAFEADAYISPKEQRKMDRFIKYCIAAADEALIDAGWNPKTDVERERTGTVIASGVGGFPAMIEGDAVLRTRGPRRVSPFLVPSFLANLAAGHVSMRHKFKGLIGAPVTACAAGAQAIGDAFKAIKLGEVDVVVAGGTEACINRLSLAGFAASKALSTDRNDAAETASRPFDESRSGFVMGEGAGVVVLEALDHARARGARIYAKLTGYGASADAHHITAPPADGEGAQRAMRAAMSQAGVRPDDIDYINAHSTSTWAGDLAELNAVKALFGPARKLSMSSTKSAIGHLLGAAGAVEAVFTVMAMVKGVVPPTLNLRNPSSDYEGLDLVPLEAKRKQVAVAMSNAFGFGGVNASLIFAQPDR